MSRAILAVVAFISIPSLHAEDLMVFPAKGQTAEQQAKDKTECNTWAVGQSGFDPSKPAASQVAAVVTPPPPQAEAPKGGAVRGGARGAAAGAAIGAIAGDAGKGAAIGAAAGGMGGAARKRDQQRDQAAAQKQYEAQLADAQAKQNAEIKGKQDQFKRAMTACLEGKGYTVK